ncbi:hypothetical protein BRADI_5g01518v3 [Brachypodium distachyon]|uniref:Uncharacterized protein n=1 Tax=Brachypodium distachyon TaxID=15368 RepID=A0A0Q3H0M5_BRADI|nr:hypothetical protein BRADI_5g01518v3 [Brachypodium distachyon]KQJ81577.1 hypothetical protein BRADI_5g01518v3 [Brachypodium distachyon]KQJ81578.1 hypothetical protein BRADI_5g01518v3 [Brachypodium distachyon]KQJ81579.1 hypothetical protein BRADI_5g01518v3 [Brachypodium distachyon]KQJ81580.1 hypothetical protein BRADI_5g01518v3 [Brachypodium distachyon]
MRSPPPRPSLSSSRSGSPPSALPSSRSGWPQRHRRPPLGPWRQPEPLSASSSPPHPDLERRQVHRRPLPGTTRLALSPSSRSGSSQRASVPFPRRRDIAARPDSACGAWTRTPLTTSAGQAAGPPELEFS